MLQFVLKYRFLLLILFLTVGGQVSAHMQSSYHYGTASNYDRLVIKASQSAQDQESSKLDVAEKEVEEDEVEDDDINFSRKHFDASHSGIFLTPIYGYSVIYIKNNFFHSDPRISEISSQKYLLFEVFRI